MNRFTTLQAKFVLGILPIVVIVAALFSGIFALQNYRQMRDALTAKQRVLPEVYGRALSALSRDFSPPAIARVIGSLTVDPDVARATVLDADDLVVAQIKIVDLAESERETIVEQPIVDEMKPSPLNVKGKIRVVFHDRAISKAIKGGVVRDVSLILLLVAAIVLAAVIANKIIIGRPLERFLQAIRRADEERVREPVAWSSKDEIGRVILAYNQMLVKLDAEEAALRERTNELTRSVTELRALGDVMQAVNSSLDLQQVLVTIVTRAVELLRAKEGTIYEFDQASGVFEPRANYGVSNAMLESLRESKIQMGDTAVGQCAEQHAPVQLTNVEKQGGYRLRDLLIREGIRSILAVPLLREEKVIGALVVRRTEAGEFPPPVVALLQTFAAQSVLAIQNARLFEEIREALDQQTAVSDILGVISSSPTNIQPVFDAILENATRLCEAHMGHLGLYDGEMYQYVAQRGASAEYSKFLNERGAFRPGIGDGIPRMIAEGRPIQISDRKDSSDYRDRRPATVALVQSGGARTYIAVPMLKEGRVVGGITIYRPEVRPFTKKQIDLVSTFANQAVIAIENVRLFKEIQEKSEQLAAASQHKSQFLANMSHELRTPLNAIIGFSDVLLEKMFGEINPKQERYITQILASGKHLLSLINDILDLSKIEAGRMELEVSTVHIRSALQDAIMLVRERAQSQDITLLCNIDPQIAGIAADERKFKQIMLNLLSNAVKFTPEHGRVEVDARLLDDYLEVSVKDTGVGIAEKDQAAVFEEFRQVGRHYSAKQEGTGLGLALTRRFVELHGGTVRLESELGKGSTFTFTLPVHR